MRCNRDPLLRAMSSQSVLLTMVYGCRSFNRICSLLSWAPSSLWSTGFTVKGLTGHPGCDRACMSRGTLLKQPPWHPLCRHPPCGHCWMGAPCSSWASLSRTRMDSKHATSLP